jgi:hypothetical protein
MDFLKNISVNLHATGPAAVMIAWCLSITMLGVFGDGQLATMALTILNIGGVLILGSLAARS